LKIKESLLTQLHPDIIAIKHNLGKKFLLVLFKGELYLAMGLEEKAKEYMLEAMELIRKLEEGRHGK
jgi:hypothetical protein